MTTYINQIVQAKKAAAKIEERVVFLTGDARREAEAEWTAASDRSRDLILEAMRAGVETDLIEWATGIHADERILTALRETARAMAADIKAGEAIEALAA